MTEAVGAWSNDPVRALNLAVTWREWTLAYGEARIHGAGRVTVQNLTLPLDFVAEALREHFALDNTHPDVVARFVTLFENVTPLFSELRRIAPVTLAFEAYRELVESRHPEVAIGADVLELLQGPEEAFPVAAELRSDFRRAVQEAARLAPRRASEITGPLGLEELRELLDAREVLLQVGELTGKSDGSDWIGEETGGYYEARPDMPKLSVRQQNDLAWALDVAVRYSGAAANVDLFQRDLTVALAYTPPVEWDDALIDRIVVSLGQESAAEAIEATINPVGQSFMSRAEALLESATQKPGLWTNTMAHLRVGLLLDRAVSALSKASPEELLHGPSRPLNRHERAELRGWGELHAQFLSDVQKEYKSLGTELSGDRRRLYERYSERTVRDLRNGVLEKLRAARQSFDAGDAQASLSMIRETAAILDGSKSPFPRGEVSVLFGGRQTLIAYSRFRGITGTFERAIGLACVQEYNVLVAEEQRGGQLSPIAQRAGRLRSVVGEPPTDAARLQEYCFLATEVVSRMQGDAADVVPGLPTGVQSRLALYQQSEHDTALPGNVLGKGVTL